MYLQVVKNTTANDPYPPSLHIHTAEKPQQKQTVNLYNCCCRCNRPQKDGAWLQLLLGFLLGLFDLAALSQQAVTVTQELLEVPLARRLLLVAIVDLNLAHLARKLVAHVHDSAAAQYKTLVLNCWAVCVLL